MESERATNRLHSFALRAAGDMHAMVDERGAAGVKVTNRPPSCRIKSGLSGLFQVMLKRGTNPQAEAGNKIHHEGRANTRHAVRRECGGVVRRSHCGERDCCG